MTFIKSGSDTSTPLSDEEIVLRVIKNGDQQLLSTLYDRYCDRIYRKCLSITRDKNTAKDLTHDIFIKIFRSLDKFQGKSKLSLWIHSISYNHCMNHLKKEKKLKFDSLDSMIINDPKDDKSESLDAEFLELQLSQLSQVFNQLHPEEKLILLMRYKDEMPVKVIAETLNIKLSAAKMRLKRSRDSLSRLFRSMKTIDV